MTRKLTAAAALLLGCAVAGWPADPPAAPRFSGEAEWVAFDDARAARVRLRAQIEGRDAGAVWGAAVEKLFAFLDRDGDGSLSPAEAARLPGAFDLRRLLWGNFAPPAGVAEGWKAADADGDGRLTGGEVASFYTSQGVGLTVGAGDAANTARLNEALLSSLDADRDGRVSLRELRIDEASLMALDRNEDELVAPGELVRGARYPGTLGSSRVPTASAGPPGLFLLPPSGGDTSWTKALRDRLAAGPPREGSLRGLDEAGLARWRRGEADLVLRASWGKGGAALARVSGKATAAGGAVEWKAGDSAWSFRADEGRLPELAKKAQARTEEQFDAADVGKDGHLTAKTPAVAKDVNLRHLLGPTATATASCRAPNCAAG